MHYLRALLSGILLTAASTASAGVIISNLNGNDGTQTAGIDDLRNKGMGFTMASGNDYSLDFVTLRLDITGTPGDVDPIVQIWSNVGGSPGAALTTLSDPLISATGINNYVFSATAPFTLLADTTYWLVVSGAVGASGFDWKASSPAVTPTGIATHFGAKFDTNGLPPTGNSSIINSYSINASEIAGVPVPGSIALLGIGLAGFGYRRCRQMVA